MLINFSLVKMAVKADHAKVQIVQQTSHNSNGTSLRNNQYENRRCANFFSKLEKWVYQLGYGARRYRGHPRLPFTGLGETTLVNYTASEQKALGRKLIAGFLDKRQTM